VLLDIHMPVMNGIEFLKIAPVRPMVIITSAYPQYALEGFQLDVLDYLVKPIVFSRFYKAVSKALDYARMTKPAAVGSAIVSEPAAATQNFFFIKCDYRYEKILFDDILFIEAVQNYVTIHTTQGNFMTLLSLKNIEEKLDAKAFIRVHKSFVIAIDKVKAIENNEIILGAFRVPLSRNYRDEVLVRVVEGRLWRR
jgi:DNA-binding LytR/AlgR family response regulator